MATLDEFVVSDPIKISEFLKECKSCMSDYDLCANSEFNEDESIEYPESFDIKSRFDLASLQLENGYSDELLKSVRDTKGLKVLELRRNELERKTNRPEKLYDGPCLHSLYNGRNPPSSLKAEEKIQHPDVFLTIHFYRAYKKKKPPLIKQEFDVLGETTLSSLREKLSCLSDYIILGDMAANPDAPVTRITKHLYKSGFFFIEGTFYNDMSHSSCIDLSKVIKEWADERTDRIGPFKYAPIDGVKFKDLTLRLGHPYLYMHQGNCEHHLVFSDLRLATEQDCVQICKYPLETFKSGERGSMCRSCELNVAKWVTYGSSFCWEDPCFFCDLCLKMLHYDNKSTLIDPKVKVYHYPHYYSNISSHADDEFHEDGDNFLVTEAKGQELINMRTKKKRK